LDFAVPEMDGVDRCQNGEPIAPSLPFILMTGSGKMDQSKEIAEMRILQKPILQKSWTDSELAEEVTQALGKESASNQVMLPGMKQRTVVPM
jgi:DNA-binding NtrC family response regulator